MYGSTESVRQVYGLYGRCTGPVHHGLGRQERRTAKRLVRGQAEDQSQGTGNPSLRPPVCIPYGIIYIRLYIGTRLYTVPYGILSYIGYTRLTVPYGNIY